MFARGANGSRSVAPDRESLDLLFETNLKATSGPIERGLLASLKEHRKDTKGRFNGVLYLAHTMAPYQGLRYRVGRGVFQRLGPQPSEEVMRFVTNFNLFWQDLEASGTDAI
jgi:hypothetical protein